MTRAFFIACVLVLALAGAATGNHVRITSQDYHIDASILATT